MACARDREALPAEGGLALAGHNAACARCPPLPLSPPLSLPLPPPQVPPSPTWSKAACALTKPALSWCLSWAVHVALSSGDRGAGGGAARAAGQRVAAPHRAGLGAARAVPRTGSPSKQASEPCTHRRVGTESARPRLATVARLLATWRRWYRTRSLPSSLAQHSYCWLGVQTNQILQAYDCPHPPWFSHGG